MARKYDFPVWATQGGGLVREFNGTYVFVEAPDVSGLDVGDVLPSEWGLVPANDLARGEEHREEREAMMEGIPSNCPSCGEGGRVGPSTLGPVGWYCYNCSYAW